MSRKAPCADLAELRSAFVDGSIDGGARERLLGHLVDCRACREEVAELRAVRSLLRRGGEQPVSRPPADLSGRLVEIAGPDAAQPMWTRPFHRHTPAGWHRLPSARRSQRRRMSVAAVGAGALLVLTGAVGYAAAPGSDLAAVADPTDEARAAFTASLGQFPLAGDALGAVMLTQGSDVSRASTVSGGPAPATGRSLSAAQARVAMARAAGAANTVSYTGWQSFLAVRNGAPVTAELEVEGWTGQGVQVKVLGQAGQAVVRGFVPAAVSARVVDDDLLALLERNYDLIGATGASVADRPATLIAAYRDGVVRARWWLDVETGLPLWQESYDDTGAPELSFGFTTVVFEKTGRILEHLPPRLVVPVTNTALTLSSAPDLTSAGWSCAEQLAGLTLVRLRSNAADDPTAVHLVYSDGVSTVTVFEQRGRLDAAPAGSAWDEGMRAYLSHGASTVASWSSDRTVFTVVTDGSPALLAEAVASLPHSGGGRTTTMGRIREGWAKILADVRG